MTPCAPVLMQSAERKRARNKIRSHIYALAVVLRVTLTACGVSYMLNVATAIAMGPRTGIATTRGGTTPGLTACAAIMPARVVRCRPARGGGFVGCLGFVHTVVLAAVYDEAPINTECLNHMKKALHLTKLRRGTAVLSGSCAQAECLP